MKAATKHYADMPGQRTASRLRGATETPFAAAMKTKTNQRAKKPQMRRGVFQQKPAVTAVESERDAAIRRLTALGAVFTPDHSKIIGVRPL